MGDVENVTIRTIDRICLGDADGPLDAITVSTLPSEHGPLLIAIFFSHDEQGGMQPFQLETNIREVSTGEIVASHNEAFIPTVMPDPPLQSTHVIPIEKIVFRKLGQFRIEVFLNGASTATVGMFYVIRDSKFTVT